MRFVVYVSCYGRRRYDLQFVCRVSKAREVIDETFFGYIWRVIYLFGKSYSIMGMALLYIVKLS